MSELSPEACLAELLSEGIAAVMNRERVTFDVSTSPFSDLLVLFGAGNLGRKALAGLRRIGVEPLAFADNNPVLWNTCIRGLNVLSPQDAAERFAGRAAFVVTIWNAGKGSAFSSIRQQLLNLECSKIVSFASLFWKYPDIYLPHPSFDLPHKIHQEAENVQKAMSLWGDDASRREYLAQLRLRTLLDFLGLPPPVAEEQYFPGDLFTLSPDEVFVDCGAFDGDTLRSFLQCQIHFSGRIIALEPDPANLQKLQEHVSTLAKRIRNRVTVLQLAAGSARKKVRFEATGTASSTINAGGALEVDCAPLDETLSGSAPTYIKMDIEGAELDALAGARRIIEQSSPVLAVCTYHQHDHLWKIPLMIESLHSGYHFFLRRYLNEVWEVVCYAVPDSRLIA